MIENFKPKCVFCSAEWSDDNVSLEDTYASAGCDTCGHGSSVSGTITISCHVCKKVMYQKDGNWD